MSRYLYQPPGVDRAEALVPVTRWRPETKWRLCWALENGVVTRAEVRDAHNLSEEELDGWIETFRQEGVKGFVTTPAYRRRHGKLELAR